MFNCPICLKNSFERVGSWGIYHRCLMDLNFQIYLFFYDNEIDIKEITMYRENIKIQTLLHNRTTKIWLNWRDFNNETITNYETDLEKMYEKIKMIEFYA